MDFIQPKPRLIVENGKFVFVKDKHKSLEERVNQLTATVENMQKILDRFIALYESEKVAVLSKQKEPEKAKVETIVAKVSEKDNTQTINVECHINLNIKHDNTEQPVPIDESQQSVEMSQEESEKEPKMKKINDVDSSKNKVLQHEEDPDDTQKRIDQLKTVDELQQPAAQSQNEGEENNETISVDMEKLDLKQENINLKRSIERQTTVYIQDKLKWEEERDKLQRELEMCKSLLQSCSVTIQDAPISQDVLRSHTKPYECSKCNDFTTYSKDYYEFHRKVDCNITTKYECSICKKQFMRKDNYERHRSVHGLVKTTGKYVVLKQMKGIEASIARNKRRQQIRLEYECQFSTPRNTNAVQSKQQEEGQEIGHWRKKLREIFTAQKEEKSKKIMNAQSKKTDEKKSELQVKEPVVNQSARVRSKGITNENLQSATADASTAVDGKDLSFSRQYRLMFNQQLKRKPENKVSESEEIQWLRGITSKTFPKAIYISSAPAEAAISNFEDKQTTEEKLQEPIIAENKVTAMKSSETKQPDKPINLPSVLAEAAKLEQVVKKQAKQQTLFDSGKPSLVPAMPVQNLQESAAAKNTHAEDKETGETLQRKQQNVPPVVSLPSSPETESQVPMPISNDPIDDNIRRNLRQRFMMQLLRHCCEDSCTIRYFVDCMEHASKCTYGAECNWYICKCIHGRVEHLKMCQDKIDCTICQPYVYFNENKMQDMMKVLDRGCPGTKNGRRSLNIVSREAIMTMVAKLAVSYGLVGDDEKIDDEEIIDALDDINEDYQLSESSSDNDESNTSSSSSSSSKTTTSEEWEVC